MPMNFARTGLLLAVLTGILVAMGGVIGGQAGMVIALVVAAGINLFSYWRSDSMVLSMYGAEEVDANSGGEYYRIVQDLAQRAGLPMPRVYVMHNPQPNAFATGRNPDHAAVCASTGLLEMLSPEEISGVLAHELAHVKNYDTLTMAVAATIGGAISMLAQYLQFGALFGGHRENNNGIGWIGALVAMIVAPLAAMLVQMAISRSREYQADRLGAMICGQPLMARLGAGQNRWLCAPGSQRTCRGCARHGPSLHHQPAERGRHGQPVLHPSQYRKSDRRTREACGRDGSHRAELTQ